MSVVALKPNYVGVVRDAKDQFNGQQVLFIEWLGHLSISAPIAILVDAHQRFSDFIEQVMGQTVFASHPDWAKIDWLKVQWFFEGQTLTYDQDSTFENLGINHKSYLRLRTPDLNGI